MPCWAWYMVQTIMCCKAITIKYFFLSDIPSSCRDIPSPTQHVTLWQSTMRFKYLRRKKIALGELPTQKWTFLRRRNSGHSCEASNANWCKCLPRTKIYFYTRIGHSSKTQLLTFLQSPQVAKFLKPLSVVWPPSSPAPLHHSYCYKMVTETSSLLRVDHDGEDVDDDCG